MTARTGCKKEKKMKKLILAIILFSALDGFAGNTSRVGLVTQINLYGDSYSPTTTNIKFKTDNMEPGVDWYIIPQDFEFRKEMVSMLLTSKTTGNKLRVYWHATVTDAEEKVQLLIWE